jgi:hypothetical protein
MLNAVLRPLRRAFPGYIFELHARVNAKEIFRYEPTYGAIRTYQLVDDDPADAIIPLDGVLEVDHSSSEVDQHHRVDLFRRFLLKGFDPMPKLKLDWDAAHLRDRGEIRRRLDGSEHPQPKSQPSGGRSPDPRIGSDEDARP